MIHDSDAEFHYPEDWDPTWAETNYFGFYVPQLEMNCGVYALFRNTQRVVNTNVSMNRRQVRAPWEADYWDFQVHVPIPGDAKLTDYSLSNGLRVKCTRPNMEWEVHYDDGMGTEIHFEYVALTEPFDIHDPNQDPMVAAKAEGSDFAWGTAYNGHFDQSGRYQGEIILRGERHEFECVSTMDHSWGPRPEKSNKSMSWLHAHTEDGKVLHAIFDFDPTVRPDGTSELRLTHGYVVEDGELFGLKAATGTSRRDGLYPMHTVIEATDSRDKTHHLEGRALTTFPWQAWPGVVGFNVLHRWDFDGDAAMGESMDFLGLAQIGAIYSQ